MIDLNLPAIIIAVLGIIVLYLSVLASHKSRDIILTPILFMLGMVLVIAGVAGL